MGQLGSSPESNSCKIFQKRLFTVDSWLHKSWRAERKKNSKVIQRKQRQPLHLGGKREKIGVARIWELGEAPWN